MRALAGEEILEAWERARALPQHQAALACLALAMPERTMDNLATMPLGERNALLLELRAATLGQRMDCFAVCPDCGAQLEVSLDARELAEGLREQAAALPALEAGHSIRPANTLDLIASGAATDEVEAQAILLSRTANLSGSPSPAMIEEFDRINSAAEISVQLECAACSSRPLLDLDIARFFLREISSAARRLLADIHTLASAYGWSEQAIAALSPTRRAAYLEMVSA